MPWIDHLPWGKGKGKKGWRRSKGWPYPEEHRAEELDADERRTEKMHLVHVWWCVDSQPRLRFEKKLATLRELRLASDEVLLLPLTCVQSYLAIFKSISAFRGWILCW